MSAARKKRKTGRAPRSKAPGDQGSPLLESIESRLDSRVYFLVAVAAALAYTWPLALGIGGRIMGGYSNYYGDVFGGIWELWATRYEIFHLGSNPLVIDMLAGPFASYFYSPLAFHKYLLIMAPVTAAAGPVVSFNVYTLLNFVLAALCARLLMLELGAGRTASSVAALAFAFCPYAYAHAIVHMDLAATWPMPLVLYALLRLHRGRKPADWLILAAALVLFHAYCSIYYYLFLPLLAGCYLLLRLIDSFFYDFAAGRKVEDGLSKIGPRGWIIAGAALLVAVAGGYYVYVHYLEPLATSLVRPVEWQERFKLSWANFLLPGVDHPLFGDATRGMVPVRRNVTESTAYIGWAALVPAFIGLYRGRGDWRVWMLVLIGLGGLLFTLGPYIRLGAMSVPMPSLLLHKFAPFVRVISRYTVFLQLAVAALAGLGLTYLLDKYRQHALWLAGLALVIMAVEYFPPRDMTAVASGPDDSPGVYAYLAESPDTSTIFEYPARAYSGLANTDYLYFQTIHERNLFNRVLASTTIPDRYQPFWEDMDYPGALSDPNNIRLLRYFGTEYLVFHDRSGLPTRSLPVVDPSAVPGLDRVESFDRAAVYRITAEPSTALPVFDTAPYYNYLEQELVRQPLEFLPPLVLGEGAARSGWRIMADRGRLTVHNLLDEPQRVQVLVSVIAFRKDRALEVAVDDHEPRRHTARQQPAELIIGPIELAAGGSSEVLFRAPEGAERMSTGSGGTIEASVALSRVRVVRLD